MASGLLHAMVIAAGLVITWTVIQDDSRPKPRPIVSDFRSTAFLPVQTLSTPEPATVDDTPEIETPPEIMMPVLPELTEPTWSYMDMSDLASQSNADTQAEFAGARVTNARSLVYVIDASGSMMTWLPMVLEALEQSLDRLSPSQRFAVIFFQRDRAIPVPPERLVKATSTNINRVMDWADQGANLIPGGGSNPLPAMEKAFLLEPDVIFLLSEGLDGTNGSRLEVDVLFERLDSLNPIADPVNSTRWTRIQCIEIGADQKNDEDGDSTMQMIGERYGGPDGWIRLGRKELVTQPAGAP